MARIPDIEIERLKQDVSIQRLAEARGVILRRRGDELMGLCPFHEDHSPSLVINPVKNVWHCLGACQTGGSVIDWVMKSEGVSFRHAVEVLRNGPLPSCDDSPPLETLRSSGTRNPPAVSASAHMPDVVARDADTQSQLRQVIDYYHSTLKESAEALAYLSKRGIDSAEAIDTFRLGYANRTLGYHIPSKESVEGGAVRNSLQSIGIYRESGHEHFAGSLVIPVVDENGAVSEVYGRKIGERLRKGTALHLYLPGPHRGVWNIAALQSSREIILCESLIDALTFWCAGYRNVTASYGVEGFTSAHLDAFKRYGIERVLIAYDRDEAGERASLSLVARLSAEGMGCYRIQFPKGMDANEYACKVQPSVKSLGLVIEKAVCLNPGPSPAGRRGEEDRAAEGEKDDSECRAAVYPSPCAVEAARPEINADPTRAAASSVSQSPSDAEVNRGEVTISLGDRRWRIRGLEKNLSVSVLKVNILVSKGEAFHVDTFDLYAARYRQAFIKQASEELSINEDIIKRDLGKVLLELETLQEAQIGETLLAKKPSAVTLTAEDQSAAMGLLTDPNLLDRILADFEKCGVIGEETNKLVGYLAGVSRKLEQPLAVVIQSSSAAGKSSLMEAILSFFPQEERVQYSAMTGQSLFYMGEADLQHKILAIAEEEGAEKATYALKLLQSEGELTIASTGKDPATGRLETQEYRVQGPVMIFLTTTAIEIDEELLNRCIVLTVDEERAQTRAIHRLQRQSQTLEGLLARQDRSEILKVHQDAQRLLRPLLVANPFANELTFLDDRTRTRRDHMKYLTLIRSIALLRQYQRPIKQAQHQGRSVSYIEVTVADIETANRLAHQVLGRSLDELAPQTRRLLVFLDEMVTARCADLAMERCDYRFSRREVREQGGWSYEQLRVHLERLVNLEYVMVHHGGRGQSFVYELLYDGKGLDGTSFLMGLIEPESLKSRGMTKSLGGESGGFGVDLGAHTGPIPGPYRGVPPTVSLNDPAPIKPVNGKTPKFAYGDGASESSYLPRHSLVTAAGIRAEGAK